MSNLALGQQKRSVQNDDSEPSAHAQNDESRDVDDTEHARQKRALGDSYNGVNGEILIIDTALFQSNINTQLESLGNST